MQNERSEIRRSEGPRLISAKDIIVSVRLLLISTLSWLVPSRFWPALSGRLADLDIRLRKKEMATRIEEITRGLGNTDIINPEEVVRDSMVANCDNLLQHFRYYHPGGWHPDTRLVGSEYIDQGFEQGNGVILWVSNFIYSDLVTKIAFAEAGYSVSHLSRATHGFSDSELGIRVLNSVQTKIEDRYIRERIHISEKSASEALDTLQSRLKENGIVSITVGDQARRLVRPSFLAGRLRLASGASNIALKTGAVLLPVFTIKEGDWSYRSHVGQPLRADGLKGADYYEAIARQYVAQLEPFVLEHPGYWRSWHLLEGV